MCILTFHKIIITSIVHTDPFTHKALKCLQIIYKIVLIKNTGISEIKVRSGPWTWRFEWIMQVILYLLLFCASWSLGTWGCGGERLLRSWWSIMVPWASSWPWPVIRTGGKRCMSVSKAVHKLCPVFFIEGFLNPALDGAKIADSDFGNIGKEEA